MPRQYKPYCKPSKPSTYTCNIMLVQVGIGVDGVIDAGDIPVHMDLTRATALARFLSGWGRFTSVLQGGRREEHDGYAH